MAHRVELEVSREKIGKSRQQEGLQLIEVRARGSQTW